MPRMRTILRALFILVTILSLAAPAGARGTGYATGFTRWSGASGDFNTWQRDAVITGPGGTLQLDGAAAHPGSDPYGPGGYNGGNYYNGGTFIQGEAVSPVLPVAFNFREAIASWNAQTPPGTWIEIQARAQLSNRLTKWYSLGIWASDSSTVQRHSVNLQGDTDGYVAVDTLVVTNKKISATGLQLKVKLFSVGGTAVPSVRNISVAYSTTPARPSSLAPGNPANWGTLVDVPQCSQMVYPDGGNVWCSATSTSMIVGYWTHDTGPCEPRVRAAVNGVYDWIYDGHGNWPFNTAYAATYNLDAYVARFTSMAQMETWIKAGVPVAISYGWSNDLSGAPIPSSQGHLAVVVGFDAAGNPIVNDPAAASDAEVRRTYLRSELEPLWLERSGGTVYLMYPTGWNVPPVN